MTAALTALVLIGTPAALWAAPAFPGAQGWGKNAKGGGKNTDTKFYIHDNIGPGRTSDAGDDWDIVALGNQDRSLYRAAEPITELVSGITPHSPLDAYQRVLQHAGALPRDGADKRAVEDARNGSGKHLDKLEQIGGYPAYAAGTYPTDSDDDGMPDAWELAHALNPQDKSDATKLSAKGSGYLNIEEYLNSFFAEESPAPAVTKAAAPLRWSPSPLTDPKTINLGTGPTTNSLKNDQDYIIKLPAEKKIGGIVLRGGRNIVIQGGHITVPPGATSDAGRRAIYIKDVVGTVHIEGVLIANEAGSDFDGIAIAAPQATVQIQNVRIVGLTGSYAGFHADILQPWGGVKELRIDRLTGTSNYQGFQIPQDLGPIGSATIQNVNLGYVPRTDGKIGYLLWLTPGLTRCDTYPITLSNVYVEARPGQKVGNSVWPPVGKPMECAAVQDDDEVSWPKLPKVTGVVKQGPPPDGDFVPEGAAGLRYVSPGYAGG